jgi:hypothetical protein
LLETGRDGYRTSKFLRQFSNVPTLSSPKKSF